MNGIQYTIRGVPDALDRSLRAEATSTGKSVNRIVIETLVEAKCPQAPPYEDLDWFIGSGGLDERETEALDWLAALPRDLPA